MSATGAGLLRRYAPRNDSLFVVIASVAKQSRAHPRNGGRHDQAHPGCRGY